MEPYRAKVLTFESRLKSLEKKNAHLMEQVKDNHAYMRHEMEQMATITRLKNSEAVTTATIYENFGKLDERITK